MNEELCREKHRQIDKTFKLHDTRLNSHSNRLEFLEKSNAVHNTEINNLCKQIGDLITTIKWFIGLTITTLLGFFIWFIQSGIKFKG
ncbi:hemolysin XhlA family protein [Clostridium botulinum]|uniref:hemolysin XhlA family protein n=1 Tax=Clostridium botulinum TaxID=1491 RepID=UPI0004D7AD81|nr:hemolysin XhlA family protein [Clostridium botulinum]KEH99978.1 hypothetical protein Z952_14755 [Clostridium botulinum C/D str. BKT75002]KEI05700.1 hypothetical protein Z954_14935 [Clostridium botulinum C/D str. BKT2873]MCD3351775.1 hypothetical protein [Clostridium botulinum D/C]MCD3360701.1 hypothetical protein [Clostridium botulinum D/C]MCD3362127.1 hypothetical protein [Clostridium botulinum D/C]